MSYFEAVLVTEARQAGRAQRSALLRHVHLTERPLGMLLWQLGAEPFTAAAVAWGFDSETRRMVVPGEPRDRELAFRALTEAAREFNAWFEAGHAGGAPQVVVPNTGNLTLLGRLGRRLAYLPLTGPSPADPELVRLGKHLGFLWKHSRQPGQQLVVVLTDLMCSHWVTELSPLEAQQLPALDAAIEPGKGVTGHQAAAIAEQLEIGPLPGREDDTALDALLLEFNQRRQRSTDPRLIRKLLPPIETHYLKLVDRGWPLIWKCLDRERRVAEAPSVLRRWGEDVGAYTNHIAWVVGKSGNYRTRATNAQAARTMRRWEDAEQLRVAEEAIDDPLRMAPYLLNNKALRGKVVSVNLTNKGMKKRAVTRPLVELQTDEPCVMPIGRELYWTGLPHGAAYVVQAIRSGGSGSVVTLCHQSGANVARPTTGNMEVFSVLTTGSFFPMKLPQNKPWTHGRPPPPPENIEAAADARGWE
ncbi:MAG: hypothetical protein IPM35_16595 [Myxococcales bacterium]|nr:hypothetical protein [Myxococcales bacterium]